LIWLNGSLVEESRAAISVLDHGLTVGDGVFETAKTVHGVPFALTRHLERLARSAKGLKLPPPDLDEVRKGCEAVTGADPLPFGRLRITYTGGRGPLGSDRGDAPPTLVIAQSAATPRPDTTSVITVDWTRNEHSPVAGLKTTSYAENVLALAAAHSMDATEALFANNAGNLCEGTGSNVFVVVDGKLLTPTLNCGPLAGITRALVIDWCGAEETELPFEVLDDAEEVFLTSSMRDVQAVTRLGGRHLGEAPGPVTRRAMAVFAARAAEHPDPH
jgi:branched-chain amino acid aminotransferase